MFMSRNKTVFFLKTDKNWLQHIRIIFHFHLKGWFCPQLMRSFSNLNMVGLFQHCDKYQLWMKFVVEREVNWKAARMGLPSYHLSIANVIWSNLMLKYQNLKSFAEFEPLYICLYFGNYLIEWPFHFHTQPSWKVDNSMSSAASMPCVATEACQLPIPDVWKTELPTWTDLPCFFLVDTRHFSPLSKYT